MGLSFLGFGFLDAAADLPELGPDSTPGDGHDNGQNSPYFFLGKALFLGYAKVMLHSWITSNGHSRGQLYDQGCFGI
jgi:hypothetical protein